MQLTGLHLHVDAHGQEVGLHVAHLHHAVPEDHSHHNASKIHDHNVEIDVSLLEQLSASWSKLLPFLLVLVIVLAAAAWTSQRVRSLPERTGTVRHRLRWRPPLRAPPISL